MDSFKNLCRGYLYKLKRRTPQVNPGSSIWGFLHGCFWQIHPDSFVIFSDDFSRKSFRNSFWYSYMILYDIQVFEQRMSPRTAYGLLNGISGTFLEKKITTGRFPYGGCRGPWRNCVWFISRWSQTRA